MRLSRAALAPILAFSALAGQELPRVGELRVSPMEVVFQARTRTQNLTVQNTANVPATYRISLQHVRMTEDGGAEEVSGFPLSAEDLVRLSPRQIVLAPGERQTVRIMLRRPEQLPEGEYRIHVLFRVVPPEPVAGMTPSSPDGVGIHLRAIPGIAIPLFVRHGSLRQALAVEPMTWVPGPPPTLDTALLQQGSQTLRGHLRLVQLGGVSPTVLASRPLIHYADLPRQRVRLALPQGLPSPVGSLALQILDEAGKVICSFPVPRP